MKLPTKLLLIYVAEADRWDGKPLYEAIIRRLLELGIAGATVQTGVMGYGVHSYLHKKGLFGIADDIPVSIIAVDSEIKIREAMPEMLVMVKEGLVALLDIEVFVPASDPSRE